MPKVVDPSIELSRLDIGARSETPSLSATALSAQAKPDDRLEQQREVSERSDLLHARQQLDENNITFGAKILYERCATQNMMQQVGSSGALAQTPEGDNSREIFAHQLVESTAKKKKKGYTTNSEQMVLQLLQTADLPESDLQRYVEKHQEAIKLGGLEPQEFLVLARDLQQLERARASLELNTDLLQREKSEIEVETSDPVLPEQESDQECVEIQLTEDALEQIKLLLDVGNSEDLLMALSQFGLDSKGLAQLSAAFKEKFELDLKEALLEKLPVAADKEALELLWQSDQIGFLANRIVKLASISQSEELATPICQVYLANLNAAQISQLRETLSQKEPPISLDKQLEKIGGQGLTTLGYAISENNLALRDAASIEILLEQEGFDSIAFIAHLNTVAPERLQEVLKVYEDNFGSLLERLTAPEAPLIPPEHQPLLRAVLSADRQEVAQHSALAALALDSPERAVDLILLNQSLLGMSEQQRADTLLAIKTQALETLRNSGNTNISAEARSLGGKDLAEVAELLLRKRDEFYTEMAMDLLERGPKDHAQVEEFVVKSIAIFEGASISSAIAEEVEDARFLNQTTINGTSSNIARAEAELAGNWNLFSGMTGGWEAQRRGIANDKRLLGELNGQRRQLETMQRDISAAAGAAQAARQKALASLWSGDQAALSASLHTIREQDLRLAELAKRKIKGLPDLSRWHGEIRAVNLDLDRTIVLLNRTETGLRYAQTGLAIAGGVGAMVVTGGAASPFLVALGVTGAMSFGTAVEAGFDLANGKTFEEVAWKSAGRTGHYFLSSWGGAGLTKLALLYKQTPNIALRLSQNLYDEAGALVAKKGSIYSLKQFNKVLDPVIKRLAPNGTDKALVEIVKRRFILGGGTSSGAAQQAISAARAADLVAAPLAKPLTEAVGFVGQRIKEKTELNRQQKPVELRQQHEPHPAVDPKPTTDRQQHNENITLAPKPDQPQRQEESPANWSVATTSSQSASNTPDLPDRGFPPPTPPPPEVPPASTAAEVSSRPDLPPEEPPAQPPPFYPGFNMFSGSNRQTKEAQPDKPDLQPPNLGPLQPVATDSTGQENQIRFQPKRKELESETSGLRIHFENERLAAREKKEQLELATVAFFNKETLSRSLSDQKLTTESSLKQSLSESNAISTALASSQARAEAVQITSRQLVGRQIAEAEQRSLAQRLATAENYSTSLRLPQQNALQRSQTVATTSSLWSTNELANSSAHASADTNLQKVSLATAGANQEKTSLSTVVMQTAAQPLGFTTTVQSSNLLATATSQAESAAKISSTTKRNRKKVSYDLEFTAALVSKEERRKDKNIKFEKTIANSNQIAAASKQHRGEHSATANSNKITNKDSKMVDQKQEVILPKGLRNKTNDPHNPNRSANGQAIEKVEPSLNRLRRLNQARKKELLEQLDPQLRQALQRQTIEGKQLRQKVAIAIQSGFKQQASNGANQLTKKDSKQRRKILKEDLKRDRIEQLLFEQELKRRRKKRVALQVPFHGPIARENPSELKEKKLAQKGPKKAGKSKAELYRKLKQSHQTVTQPEQSMNPAVDPVKSLAALYRHLKNGGDIKGNKADTASSELARRPSRYSTKAELYRELRRKK